MTLVFATVMVCLVLGGFGFKFFEASFVVLELFVGALVDVVERIGYRLGKRIDFIAEFEIECINLIVNFLIEPFDISMKAADIGVNTIDSKMNTTNIGMNAVDITTKITGLLRDSGRNELLKVVDNCFVHVSNFSTGLLKNL